MCTIDYMLLDLFAAYPFIRPAVIVAVFIGTIACFAYTLHINNEACNHARKQADRYTHNVRRY